LTRRRRAASRRTSGGLVHAQPTAERSCQMVRRSGLVREVAPTGYRRPARSTRLIVPLTMIRTPRDPRSGSSGTVRRGSHRETSCETRSRSAGCLRRLFEFQQVWRVRRPATQATRLDEVHRRRDRHGVSSKRVMEGMADIGEGRLRRGPTCPGRAVVGRTVCCHGRCLASNLDSSCRTPIAAAAACERGGGGRRTLQPKRGWPATWSWGWRGCRAIPCGSR